VSHESVGEVAGVKLAGAAGVLGIAFPVAGLFVLPIWQFPGTGSSAADLTRFAVGHGVSLPVVMVLNAAGVALWMIFGAGVWLRLREVCAGGSITPTCFAMGLVCFVTLLLTGFVAMFVLSYRAPHIVDAPLLYDMTFGLLALSGAPTAIALGSYAAASFRTNMLPRVTGWLAAIAAIAHVALIFSLVVPSGFFSLEGQVITVIPGFLFAWILATGLSMLRTNHRAAS
jgi:hypothetical protein